MSSNCHPEVLRGIWIATWTRLEHRFLGGPFEGLRAGSRNDTISSFVLWHSFVIGYFVIRYFPKKCRLQPRVVALLCSQQGHAELAAGDESDGAACVVHHVAQGIQDVAEHSQRGKARLVFSE